MLFRLPGKGGLEMLEAIGSGRIAGKNEVSGEGAKGRRANLGASPSGARTIIMWVIAALVSQAA